MKPEVRRMENSIPREKAAEGGRRNRRPALPRAQPAVDLHIEELVLYGFSPGDRYPIGDAVENELSSLFAGQGTPEWILDGGEIGDVDGGSFHTAPGANARTIGAQVAHAVYGGLKK
jgi:hypothetical protein